MFNRLALTAAMLGSLTLTACGDSAPPVADAPALAEVADAPAADAPKPTKAPKPTAAPKVGSLDAPAPMGEPVTVGDGQWTITAATSHGATLTSDNQFQDDLTTAGQFIRISATINNGGKEALSVSSPKVVDSGGREFDATSDAYMWIEDGERCVYENLNPGLTKSCVWIYDLPADATGLALALTDGMFGDPVYAAVEAAAP